MSQLSSITLDCQTYVNKLADVEGILNTAKQTVFENKTKKHPIVLIDQSRDMVVSLNQGLSQSNYLLSAWAPDAASGVKLVKMTNPTVVIIGKAKVLNADLWNPHNQELMQAMRKNCPATKFIVAKGQTQPSEPPSKAPTYYLGCIERPFDAQQLMSLLSVLDETRLKVNIREQDLTQD